MGVIYKITSPSGKIYIGQSTRLRNRIAHYKGLHCKRQPLIYASILKYGWDAHVLEIIEDNIAEEHLNKRETFWIKELKACYKDSPLGLNAGYGGNSQVWNEENRQQFAENLSGERNPFYGKTHSDHTKAILAKKNREHNLKYGLVPKRIATERGARAVMKPVLVYNNSGNFAAEYPSLTACSRALGVPMGCIKDAVLYDSWIRGEWRVVYKTDNYPLSIKVDKVHRSGYRPVLYFLDNIVFEYPNAEAAAKEIGIPKGSIHHAARYYGCTKPMRSGHVFMYKDLFEKFITNQRSGMEPTLAETVIT
jgi:group I intron endonuclease